MTSGSDGTGPTVQTVARQKALKRVLQSWFGTLEVKVQAEVSTSPSTKDVHTRGNCWNARTGVKLTWQHEGGRQVFQIHKERGDNETQVQHIKAGLGNHTSGTLDRTWGDNAKP